jgi:acyl-coenzyme A synthetase/AMP-(fatty) acid ligase
VVGHVAAFVFLQRLANDSNGHIQVLPTHEAPLQHALIEHCREHIVHCKCPRSIDLSIKLPPDENGRLYRRKLLEQCRRQSSAKDSA